MRTPRIYQDCTLVNNGNIELSQSASKHIGKVLRMQANESIELFDGRGQAVTARINNAGEKTPIVVTVSEILPRSPQPKILTHLGQVLSKGDRMDYAIQKAVELGVSEITPLFSERCDVKLNKERALKKWQNWKNIAISACEQCLQNYLPIINPPISLASWSEQLRAELRCTFHTKDAKSFSTIAQANPSPNTIAIVVGPEGGLSENEVDALRAKNFVTVSMGPRVLRTETAPVVALSLIQQVWGDLQ